MEECNGESISWAKSMGICAPLHTVSTYIAKICTGVPHTLLGSKSYAVSLHVCADYTTGILYPSDLPN